MPLAGQFRWGFACPEGAQVGSAVSEVLRALGASLAGMWGNYDDRAKTVIVPALESRNTISSPSDRDWVLGVCYTFS